MRDILRTSALLIRTANVPCAAATRARIFGISSPPEKSPRPSLLPTTMSTFTLTQCGKSERLCFLDNWRNSRQSCARVILLGRPEAKYRGCARAVCAAAATRSRSGLRARIERGGEAEKFAAFAIVFSLWQFWRRALPPFDDEAKFRKGTNYEHESGSLCDVASRWRGGPGWLLDSPGAHVRHHVFPGDHAAAAAEEKSARDALRHQERRQGHHHLGHLRHH